MSKEANQSPTPPDTVYLIVPGLNVVTPGSASLELAQSVLRELPAKDWQWEFKRPVEAQTGAAEHYSLVSKRGQRALFYEVPWTGIFHDNKLTQETAFNSLIESPKALGFWLFAAKRLWKYKRLVSGFVTGSGLMIAWWIITLLIAVHSIDVAVSDGVVGLLLKESWWAILLFVLFTAGKRHFEFVVNVASFSRLYLKNRRFRLSAEKHVIKAWEQIQTKHPTARIAIVSHSWGTILHLNALPILRSSSPKQTITHMTMGSPAVVLSARKQSLQDRWTKAIDSLTAPWGDVSSKNDWLCAKIELGQAAGKTEFVDISYEQKFLSKISGNHDKYYSHEEVIERLTAIATAPSSG